MKKETTEIVAVNPAERLPVSNINEMQWLGQMVSQTQLFGQTNPADGLAIVAMCHQERMSWMKFSQTYHWIKGRPAKKADSILADFHKAGGKHKVIARTADRAECEFSIDGNSYTSVVDWEEAQQETFPYEGLERDVLRALAAGQKPRLKAKYQTPRSRMQMLWARCVSDGVRTVAPECVCGVYTPEEVDDFAPAATAYKPVPTPRPDAQPAAAQPAAAVSASPLSVETVPVGALAGKRWDEQETAILEQALMVEHPAFTAEMKDYIREVIAKRANTAVQSTAPTMPVPEEV